MVVRHIMHMVRHMMHRLGLVSVVTYSLSKSAVNKLSIHHKVCNMDKSLL
jgi:phenylalanyl-tRNA synthetase beta subunit